MALRFYRAADPDGHAVSFVNTVSGVDNIWEQPVAGGPPQPVTHFKVRRFSQSYDHPSREPAACNHAPRRPKASTLEICTPGGDITGRFLGAC